MIHWYDWPCPLVALVFSVWLYRIERRNNPTAPPWLLASRSAAMFVFLVAASLSRMVTHYAPLSVFARIDPIWVSLLGLGIAFSLAMWMRLLEGRQVAIVTTSVYTYVDVDPDVWPPPPSTKG